jgi:hypothetical protein
MRAGLLLYLTLTSSSANLFYDELASLCAAQPAWSAELLKYAAFHRAALPRLEASLAAARVDAATGGAAAEPLPNVTIYRVLPYASHIGWGDILPGLTSALLSSMRRGRVFLLDWPVGADGGPGAVVSFAGAPFNASYPGAAAAFAARGRAVAQWHEARAVPEGSPLPALWGPAAARRRAAAVEVFTHLNRGVFTQELWQQTPAERGWLARVLPRAADGALLFACAYRAAAPLSAAVRAAAAAAAPAGLEGAAAASRAHARAAAPAGATPLICVQVRTGVQIDPPAVLGAHHKQAAEHWAARPFACAEHALAMLGNGSTALLVVTDDARVRALAEARFGARARATAVTPQHMGFQERAAGDAAAVARAYTASLADWLLLSSCGYIVKDMNTGFSRTAGVHAAESAWLWANEEALGFVREPMGGAPCRLTAGPAKQAWAHLPAGW